MTSRNARGAGCPVCGSPDRACGAVHPDAGPVAVDAPMYAPSGDPPGPLIQARARVNGIDTIFLTTPAEAEARGWKVVTAAAPAAPAQTEVRRPVSARNEARSTVSLEGLDGLSVEKLRAAAAGLGLEGAEKLNRATLRKRIRKALAQGGVSA